MVRGSERSFKEKDKKFPLNINPPIPKWGALKSHRVHCSDYNISFITIYLLKRPKFD